MKQSEKSEVVSDAPNYRPADLEIRVEAENEDGFLKLDYILHSPNGRFRLNYAHFPGRRLRRPEAWQEWIYGSLEDLHHGRDSRNAPLTHTNVAAGLAAFGEELGNELFPMELQRTLWETRRAETVLLISNEPWIPWEIVKPSVSYDSEKEEECGFLADGCQFIRWLAGGRPPTAMIEVSLMAVIEAGSPPDLQPLSKASDEMGLLREMALRHHIREKSLKDATHQYVMDQFHECDFGLIHFIGHGEHDPKIPGNSGFHLCDGRTFRPLDLSRPILQLLQERRPLVFLNSCGSGRQGWSPSRIGGWASRFIHDGGCGAFISPQWTVEDGTAYTFAKSFYESLECGDSFGRATVEARRAVHQDPLGRLSYAVYAHPNTRLTWG